MITLELETTYPDSRAAEAVMNALDPDNKGYVSSELHVDPDNKGYVSSELHGSTIVFRMDARSAGTMRNTVDDLLACLKVAEESVGLSSEKD